MQQQNVNIHNVPLYKPDILPTKVEDRTWKFGQYFSVWMGSVHNIPAYVTIGGFFALGLSIKEVFSIIFISSIILAGMLILNGQAGYKYGIPFSILLRKSFGNKGAIFPGVLRGVIAAIMWFGLQTYAGSIALTILIGKLWPTYLTLGGSWNFFGLSLPGLLSLLLFWSINVLFIFGGMKKIGSLSKVLSPLIFIVFGGMAIWAINLAGGVSSILDYTPKGVEGNRGFILLICISAILSTWVAPIVSASDLTRFSKSNKDQLIGQITGLLCSYLLFGLASISIIVGSEIAFGTPIWNVLDVVEKFDMLFAVLLTLLTLCLSTLSINIVANIIPSGNQLSSLFPKILSFRTSAIIATVCGMAIMPWKLMENPTSIFTFLSIIGGLLSPVIGIMLTNYYLVSRRNLLVDRLYFPSKEDRAYHFPAIIATIFAGTMSLAGSFIPVLQPLYEVAWFTGIILASSSYLFLNYLWERIGFKISGTC
ncbi:MAG: cytosine permease [Bacillaceae bacterium]|nr:cytosine permease [Bacillaceae bacterium]